MNKRTAILSIFVLMLAFLIFGIINVAMGRPSLLTSKLNMANRPNDSAKDNESIKNGTSLGKIEDNKEYLNIKISGEIEDGTTGDAVKKIQYILKNKGYYKGEINGQFSQELTGGIKTFQKNNAAEETGKLTIDVIEKITGEKIEIDYSKVAFARDLYPNMTGIDVRKAQYLLAKAGYYKGEITGVFNAETKQAVINFQKDKKITQTGNIGQMTQKAMENIK